MLRLPARRPFTVREYYRMAKAGILTEDDRVQLIEGEIIQMPPIHSPHASCVDRLNARCMAQIGQSAIVRVQNPVRLSDLSEPEPDLSILRPRDDFYKAGHPGPADVFLLIEVADTTLRFDRSRKIPLYARSGVSEVWLVDLEHEAIEANWSPGPGGYGATRVYHRGERIQPQSLPALDLAVDDILG